MAPKELISLRKTLFQKNLLAVSLPVLLLGFFSVVISGVILFRAINSRNLTIIQQGALQVEKHIATMEKEIRLLAHEIEETQEERGHLERFMQSHPEYSAAWITDSNGVIIYGAPHLFNLNGLDKSRSEAFLNSRFDSDNVHFSNTLISYELQEPIVTISYPLKNGIIALEYRTSELNRYMADVAESQGFYLVLSDKSGTWIAHPDSIKVQQRERDENWKYLKSLTSTGKKDSLWLHFDDKLSSYFVNKNEQAGWMVTIYQPVDALISPLLLLITVLAIIGLLLIGFTIFQTWSMVNKTAIELEHFVIIASVVSDGEYSLDIPEVSFSELHTLREALLNMVSSIQMREKEQKQLWEQLVQSQKMEVVGALAGGIAHDFNNILTAIGGFAELIQNDLEKGEGVHFSYAEEISNSVIRASALTRQLLTFSRKEEVEIAEVEVVSCIMSLMGMLHRIVGEDISLNLSAPDEELYIEADTHHIEQILLNLTVNAADALRERRISDPTINIEIKHIDKDVIITVADNGKGIPDSVVEHIFDPFFTTKPVGKGTGMGLSTVKGIVEQHGAKIEVETGTTGTTFSTFWNHCKSVSVKKIKVKEKRKSEQLKILLTDDEPMLRKVGSTMLERLGHTVVIAKDGVEALRILSEHDGQFDVLMTDMIMPGGISGDELAKEVIGKWSDIKIVFLSGYTDDHLDDSGLKNNQFVFISKPFRIEELREALQDL